MITDTKQYNELLDQFNAEPDSSLADELIRLSCDTSLLFDADKKFQYNADTKQMTVATMTKPELVSQHVFNNIQEMEKLLTRKTDNYDDYMDTAFDHVVSELRGLADYYSGYVPLIEEKGDTSEGAKQMIIDAEYACLRAGGLGDQCYEIEDLFNK